ncbi:hypothetical protein ACFPT5_11730 [Ornithinimicrobium kibberense]
MGPHRPSPPAHPPRPGQGQDMGQTAGRAQGVPDRAAGLPGAAPTRGHHRPDGRGLRDHRDQDPRLHRPLP